MKLIEPEANTTESCRVILTDDDPEDREFITEALYVNRYKGALVQADNGRALLENLQAVRHDPASAFPDLIILDLNMPYLDGYQVLRLLNEDPELRQIPTVVLTSSSREQDAVACKQLGCLKYYRKPASLSGYDKIAKDLISILRENNAHY